MSKKKNKKDKKQIYRRLRNKFRLVIMNEETFEETFSLILSPLNVFAWGGLTAIVLITLTVLLIAFTPLRQYVPGYADIKTKRNATYAAIKADSLQLALIQKEKYLNNLKAILTGQPLEGVDSLSQDSAVDYSNVQFNISKEDSALRAEVEEQEKYNLNFSLSQSEANISSFFFFTPMNGVVSASFDARSDHFGVDIVAPENEAVKATLDGTVVLAAWTSETGYVVQLQHDNNLVSVYKHNSVLLKKEGDHVKAGEAIAIIGESGKFSDGPHLHFELWYKGNPVNPQQYIVF